jgi:hypothetical protein
MRVTTFLFASIASMSLASLAHAENAPLPPQLTTQPQTPTLTTTTPTTTTTTPTPTATTTTTTVSTPTRLTAAADVEGSSAPAAPRSAVRLTYEETPVDAAPSSAPHTRSPDDFTFLHGFRLGYGYVMNYDQPSQALNGQSLKDKLGLRSPSHFLLGYEGVYRVVTHSWLNVIILGNGMIAGLEQSKVLPSANLLIGAELKNSFQIGVGASLSPLAGMETHAMIAAGWTPRVGTVYTPIHVFFIPDVDGVHRMGVTTGVTF